MQGDSEGNMAERYEITIRQKDWDLEPQDWIKFTNYVSEAADKLFLQLKSKANGGQNTPTENN